MTPGAEPHPRDVSRYPVWFCRFILWLMLPPKEAKRQVAARMEVFRG